jgi:hypothetical protein
MVTLTVALSLPINDPSNDVWLSTRQGERPFPITGMLQDPFADDVPPAGIRANGTGGVGRPGSGVNPPPAPAGPYGLRDTSGLTSTGIPVRAQQAYARAATSTATADPSCGLTWPVLAAIGRVESNHGRFGGATLTTNGVSVPAILGIRLDGTHAGTATISDSDDGRYDGDAAYDRAVGAMQFLPGTWAAYGADADGDRQNNPQDIDDAALGAARYLCAGNSTFTTQPGRWAAVYRYNHSDSYVSLVLSLADAYASGKAGTFPTPPPNAERPSNEQATPPGPPPGIPTPPPGAPGTTPTPLPPTLPPGTLPPPTLPGPILPPVLPPNPWPTPPSPTPPTPTPPTPTPTTPTPTPTTPTPTPTTPTPTPTTPTPTPTTPTPTPTTPNPTPTTGSPGGASGTATPTPTP